MQELQIRMDEWFFTQGLVGYKKILDNYGFNVRTTYDGLIVEREHLESFPDAFFTYYLTKYSVAKREEPWLRYLHKKFKEEGDKKAKQELNKRLNKLKKSAHRYFKETEEGRLLGEAADLYRGEKEYTEQLDEALDQFIEQLSSKDIDEKLTSNFFKSVPLKEHYGQPSFLNITHNKKNIEEQKEIFYRDFIYPILQEWDLFEALDNKDEARVREVLEEADYRHFNKFRRSFKKKTIDEMQEYMDEEVFRCSFTDFPIAFHIFEELIFSPLALSIDNARNMSWNANQKAFFPLCSLARLLLFSAHAGATDTREYAVFVTYGGSFDEIYETNQFYESLKARDVTFDQIVFDLVREQKLKADYLKKRYIIYEYRSDYDSKKTLLDYMIMTPHVMKVFAEDSHLFYDVHASVKGEMIRFLLRNIDPKQFITSLLREKIKGNYPAEDVIRLTMIRHLNEVYKKEANKVDRSVEKGRVWALVKSAEAVRKKIGDKKAQGIAYRLLNAIRSNDKHTFMDTVMRVYISSELEMPGLLLEALHEDKMDFATVGNAWVAGLITDTNYGKDKGENKNE